MPWRVVIRLAFVASAVAIAFIDRLMENAPSNAGHTDHGEDHKKTA